jgi:hypothetical protein
LLRKNLLFEEKAPHNHIGPQLLDPLPRETCSYTRTEERSTKLNILNKQQKRKRKSKFNQGTRGSNPDRKIRNLPYYPLYEFPSCYRIVLIAINYCKPFCWKVSWKAGCHRFKPCGRHVFLFLPFMIFAKK